MQHERVFKVRHYECDAFDRVDHANYLRYIQETAMDASAAAGFGGDWYAKNGFVWFVRDTKIIFHASLRYGDSVRVGTRVRNMRQALSKREYTLHRTADDVLIAEAETDWAFIDSATGKPAKIPQQIREVFFPGTTPPMEPRDRFPEPATPMPSDVFRQTRVVEWRDIDPAQHVNNSVYLAYFEDCGVHAFNQRGWNPVRMQEAGFSLKMKSCRLEYRAPAIFPDELVVSTWLSDVTDATAVRHLELHRAGDQSLLVRARVELQCHDIEGDAPRAFDADFLRDVMPLSAAAKVI